MLRGHLTLKCEEKHWKGYRFYAVRKTTGKELRPAQTLTG